MTMRKIKEMIGFFALIAVDLMRIVFVKRKL
jgi:hypothetical protein